MLILAPNHRQRAKSPSARPELFFDFDILTGDLLPKQGLGSIRRKKAMQMIDDLKLNALHHRKKRWECLRLCEVLFQHSDHDPRCEALLRQRSTRSSALPSITRVKLAQLGGPVDAA